jgi:hypothetical protein
MSEEISELKDAEKGQFDTQNEIPLRRRRENNWIGGVVLIGIGVIFLLSNTVAGFHINNWWALFIMIPAVANFGNAWRNYQSHGQMSRSVRGSLTGGIILTLIASAFLFNLDWGLIWPLFLIVGGLSAVLGGWFD